ncbi:hypothetical protein ACWGLF_07440 [Streptomyces puniciscabiei]
MTAVVGAVAVVAGAGFWLSAGHGTRHATAAKPAGHAPTAHSERSAEPSTASTSMVTMAQAFPAHVDGYTKLYQTGGPHCTSATGPNLTALMEATKGCRGVIGALYKDASNDQYTIVAFGMNDPADASHLATVLSIHQMDYEVPMLVPPAGSGLQALPADSGLLQAFVGEHRLLVVGMAQWSDGRIADLGRLEDKLEPLLGKVRREAAAHDRG